jgi:hypothetical protein
MKEYLVYILYSKVLELSVYLEYLGRTISGIFKRSNLSLAFKRKEELSEYLVK